MQNRTPASPADSPTLPEEAIAALQQGKKIEAMKAVREAFRVNLKAAKVMVDAYVASHPELQAQNAADHPSGIGVVFWLLAMFGAGALVAWLGGR